MAHLQINKSPYYFDELRNLTIANQSAQTINSGATHDVTLSAETEVSKGMLANVTFELDLSGEVSLTTSGTGNHYIDATAELKLTFGSAGNVKTFTQRDRHSVIGEASGAHTQRIALDSLDDFLRFDIGETITLDNNNSYVVDEDDICSNPLKYEVTLKLAHGNSSNVVFSAINFSNIKMRFHQLDYKVIS